MQLSLHLEINSAWLPFPSGIVVKNSAGCEFLIISLKYLSANSSFAPAICSFFNPVLHAFIISLLSLTFIKYLKGAIASDDLESESISIASKIKSSSKFEYKIG